MRHFFETELWKWVHVLLELAAVAFIIIMLVILARDAVADDAEIQCWVMCRPESFVTLRSGPRKSANDFGGAMLGASMMTNGEKRNGFLHVFGLAAEEEEGWISAGYIVYDAPIEMNRTATVVSNGRLAARKNIGGKVKTWLQPMTTVRIICWSSEWCLTNYGYVMTEFLELDGEDG